MEKADQDKLDEEMQQREHSLMQQNRVLVSIALPVVIVPAK